MKKVVLVFVCILLCFSLCCCGGNTANENTAPEEVIAESTGTAEPEVSVDTTPEPAEQPCEHDWAEANKQSPKTCTICGETEGEKLPADFETYGIKTYEMPIGEENAIPFAFTYYDLEFSGKAYFDDLESETYSDGYAGYSGLLYLVFDQDDVPSFPFKLNHESYYDIDKWDAVTEETSGYAVARYRSVDWNGVEYDKCESFIGQNSGAEQVGDKSVVSNLVIAKVPVGYDGVVAGFFPADILWEEGSHVYDLYPECADSWYMFRLDPANFPTAE